MSMYSTYVHALLLHTYDSHTTHSSAIKDHMRALGEEAWELGYSVHMHIHVCTVYVLHVLMCPIFFSLL